MNTSAEKGRRPAMQTVLALDGEVLVRMPIAEYLRDCGYRVLEAANTDGAVAILQKPDIRVDVVLAEIEIPGSMNGFGFAQWARSARPELRIILAGTPERAADNAGELCDQGPLFTKPYQPSSCWSISRGFSLLGGRSAKGDVKAGSLTALLRILPILARVPSKVFMSTNLAPAPQQSPHTRH
jgi:CheY-like chemotaxis protein